MQVQAQKDAYAAHQMKELHARHASLRHSLKALHAAYTQLRLRLEDMVGHLLNPEAQFVHLLMFLLLQKVTVLQGISFSEQAVLQRLQQLVNNSAVCEASHGR